MNWIPGISYLWNLFSSEPKKFNVAELKNKKTIIIGSRKSGKTNLLLNIGKQLKLDKSVIMSKFDKDYYETYGQVFEVYSTNLVGKLLGKEDNVYYGDLDADGKSLIIDECIFNKEFKDPITTELFKYPDMTILVAINMGRKIPQRIKDEVDYLFISRVEDDYIKKIYNKWIKGVTIEEFTKMIEECIKNESFLVYNLRTKIFDTYKLEMLLV